jgi:hypothetical protein
VLFALPGQGLLQALDQPFGVGRDPEQMGGLLQGLVVRPGQQYSITMTLVVLNIVPLAAVAQRALIGMCGRLCCGRGCPQLSDRTAVRAQLLHTAAPTVGERCT